MSGNTYTPIFPKTVPCTGIIVIDLAKDKSYKTWEAKEALMAATVIQGLVNRTSPEKIYFVNYPNEHFWNPPATDLQQIETEGFFPVKHTYAKLPMEKKYPALSYLLSNYSSYIEGKVLYPSLSDTVCDGAVMAAVTVCGQTDSIPVSSAIDEYIKGEGYNFALKEDTSVFTNNIDAFDWAKKNYFTDKTTKAFIGQHSYTAFGGKVHNQFPIMYDYFISHRAFVFCLNGNVEEEKCKLPEILNTDCYPLATPVIGLPVDEQAGLTTIENNGYFFSIANVQNMSCTCAFPSDPARLHPQPEPNAVSVEDNTVYVAFYVTDGDSMGFTTVFHYNDMKNLPGAGKLPIGWSVNPTLLDLYPSLMEWTWKYAPGNYEMISDWNDQNYGTLRKSNQEAWEIYCDKMQEYLGPMGLYTANDFEKDVYFARKVKPFYLIQGYTGTNGCPSEFKMVGDTVVSYITGVTQIKDAALIEYDIRNNADNTSGNQPVFLLVAVGDGRAAYGGGEITLKVKEVMDRLNSAPGERKYVFLKPKDLAATWKQWNEGK